VLTEPEVSGVAKRVVLVLLQLETLLTVSARADSLAKRLHPEMIAARSLSSGGRMGWAIQVRDGCCIVLFCLEAVNANARFAIAALFVPGVTRLL